MTDREMLELAAKAANLRGEKMWVGEAGISVWTPELGTRFWNPFVNYGDRYWLARACNLIVDFDGGEVRFFVGLGHWPRIFCFEKGNDEAEGRAVVEAAAEIGRAMG